ncbi:Preprotein translocase subunit [gamma proteobacterium HdN1]|nr:Preprotein translocase subunit [gamma proteobacterium HdN1]
MAKNLPAKAQGGPTQGVSSELIARIKFLLLAMVVYRIGAHIPVPGIDPEQLKHMFQQQAGTILSLFNMFSGGALERMSVMALGIMPYISASIIMQLMQAVSPQLEQLKKEGEAGRRKISQYTRYGTLGLGVLQSFGMSLALQSQGVTLAVGLAWILPAVLTLTTGTMFLMWLGEQITERGIGNGISMIIFAGIVAGLPQAIGQSLESARQGELSEILLVALLGVAVLVVAGVVFMERAQRRITIHHARKQQGRAVYQAQQSHLPLKINMAGVIPPIFATSILLFPASLGQWFGETEYASWLQDVANALNPGQPLYVILFAAANVFFCYFYTAIMFNPKDVAENLKKSGALVPGIRPGEQTARYIDSVLGRLTFIGSIYITLVCLLPLILQAFGNVPFYLGGTSLLIVVVVVMDFMSQVQSHMLSHQYEPLMKKANLKGYGSSGITR